MNRMLASIVAMFWGQTWDPVRDMPSLEGKVIIVTGGNSGLGRESVKHLAAHGAKVYLAARNESTATTAADELRKEVQHLVFEKREAGDYSRREEILDGLHGGDVRCEGLNEARGETQPDDCALQADAREIRLKPVHASSVHIPQ